MDEEVERYKDTNTSRMQHARNDYYDYLKKMKKDQVEDASEYSASFMVL